MTIESFNSACGGVGGARYNARFDAVADRVSAALASEGLTLNQSDRESLKALGGVKICVFGAESFDESILEAVKSLPGVSAQLHQREVAARLDQGAAPDLQHMSRAARLTYGRELEAARAAQRAANPPAGLSAESEAEAIRTLRRLPAAARIATARAMGLI